jgi:hypothetical protein
VHILSEAIYYRVEGSKLDTIVGHFYLSSKAGEFTCEKCSSAGCRTDISMSDASDEGLDFPFLWYTYV